MNSLNISGAVDDSGNNMKDYRFVNADFEGQMSVPIQFLTSEGREQIGKAFKEFGSNTVKAWGDTGGAVWRAGYGAVTMSGGAFAKFDDILDRSGRSIENARLNNDFNEYIHERTAQDYGKYVGNPALVGVIRTFGELAQFVQYSAAYDQNHPTNWKYDPLGMYDSSKGGVPPLLKGEKYRNDMLFDVENTVNGALGKFDPKFYEKE